MPGSEPAPGSKGTGAQPGRTVGEAMGELLVTAMVMMGGSGDGQPSLLGPHCVPSTALSTQSALTHLILIIANEVDAVITLILHTKKLVLALVSKVRIANQ